MITIDLFKPGFRFFLPNIDQGSPFPGCRKIPKGYFLVQDVRRSFVANTGRPEYDIVVEVIKISKDGKQIGKYRYDYFIGFFMKHGVEYEN